MTYLHMIAALAFVLALMGLLALALKKLGLSGAQPGKGKSRLSVSEALPLDSKRRLLLVRRDGKEHLVILGPNGDTVLETGIEQAAPEEQADDVKKPFLRAHRPPTL